MAQGPTQGRGTETVATERPLSPATVALVRAAVLDALRSPEGVAVVRQVVAELAERPSTAPASDVDVTAAQAQRVMDLMERTATRVVDERVRQLVTPSAIRRPW